MSFQLSEIHVFPIKSLGGIALSEAKIERRGLEFDRRWMLINSENRFVTQREIPEMALLRLEIKPPFLEIFHQNRPTERLQIDLRPEWENWPSAHVEVWDWQGFARVYESKTNHFFSETLKNDLRLVFMPDSTERQSDLRFAEKGQFVSFADGFPFLIIGQAALENLNQKLAEPLPMNRFRPNFVFSGGAAHDEDSWSEFSIGEQFFKAVKPCARCVMTTINQETTARAAEPLKTLASYRFQNNKILFGQNVVWLGSDGSNATVKIGQEIRQRIG